VSWRWIPARSVPGRRVVYTEKNVTPSMEPNEFMPDMFSPILQWINAHPELAGLATFGISAGESVAILGTIIPGTVMMTAIGTLAGAGVIPL